MLVLVAAGAACACERTTVEPVPEPEPPPPPPAAERLDTVSALTFNIMHDAARRPESGNIPPWEDRRDAVALTLDSADADVVGLQEAYLWQVEWLVGRLPEYAYVGRGRDADGEGESVAILYKEDTFSLEDSGHFWLSPTPDVPGSVAQDGWGGMVVPRIVTWVRLAVDDRELYVYNTHLPADESGGAEARRMGVRLLAARIAERERDDAPFLLLGDFNASEREFPLRYLRREVPCEGGGCAEPPPLSPVGVLDTWREVHSGAGGTRCRNDASGARVPEADGLRIDYVLVGTPAGDDTDEPEVVSSTNFLVGEACASDHRPVLSRVVLELR